MGRGGGSVKPKNKEMCEAKFNWNFQRCGGVFYRKTEVWAISVTTHVCIFVVIEGFGDVLCS